MSATSVNKLIDSFENPTIPLINSKPIYARIHSLHKLLNSNLVSARNNLGCGTVGHLCLNLYPAVYATLSATKVVPPPNTGAAPVILAGATGPKAASLRYSHNVTKIAFNMFQNIDCALRQKLLGTVKENFVRVLYRTHRGYRRSIRWICSPTCTRRMPSSPMRTGLRTTSTSERHTLPQTPSRLSSGR